MKKIAFTLFLLFFCSLLNAQTAPVFYALDGSRYATASERDQYEKKFWDGLEIDINILKKRGELPADESDRMLKMITALKNTFASLRMDYSMLNILENKELQAYLKKNRIVLKLSVAVNNEPFVMQEMVDVFNISKELTDVISEGVNKMMDTVGDDVYSEYQTHILPKFTKLSSQMVITQRDFEYVSNRLRNLDSSNTKDGARLESEPEKLDTYHAIDGKQ